MTDAEKVADCYGKRHGKRAECASCEYGESCKYYGETQRQAESPRNRKLTSYEASAHHDDLAVGPEIPGEADEILTERQKPVFSAADMERLLHFLLFEVDDYTVAIIECMLREEHDSAAQVAKAFGVSREAIRRKVTDSCRKFPELAQLFRDTLKKCARVAKQENRKFVSGKKRIPKKLKRAKQANKNIQMELF